MAIFANADGVEVRHAGLERIAHRADGGPMTIRPAFESAAAEDRQPLATRPPEVGGQRRLGRPGMNAERVHLSSDRGPGPFVLSTAAAAGDDTNSISSRTAAEAF